MTAPEASTSSSAPVSTASSVAETLQQNNSQRAPIHQNAHKVSGRDWKAPRQPTRTQKKKLTTWEERQEAQAKMDSVKKLERDMRADKEAEKQQCVASHRR